MSIGDYVEQAIPLRDYFAARALQGLLADPNVDAYESETLDDFAEETAVASYIYSDAMLRARK